VLTRSRAPRARACPDASRKRTSFPDETSWVLHLDDVVIATLTLSGLGLSGGETIDFALSLQAGVYEWTIQDQFGDGICCDYGLGRYVASQVAAHSPPN
jgi:hypothetical protein